MDRIFCSTIRAGKSLLVGLLVLNAHTQLSEPMQLNAADWPSWRGPNGNGISAETDAPMKWSSSENIAWRTLLPGKGRSSPIVSGSRVFVTTGVEEDQSRRVLCIDRTDGRILWSTSVHNGPGGKMHQDNTMASSTPAADGERVYAAFVDDQGMKVVALDYEGRIVWSASPGTYFSNHGFAASPVMYGDGVIVNGQAGWNCICGHAGSEVRQGNLAVLTGGQSTILLDSRADGV